MGGKLWRLKRREIKKFVKTNIGKTIDKKMKTNKIIIITQWAIIAALVGAIITILMVLL